MRLTLIIVFLIYNAGFILSGAINWPFQLSFVSVATVSLFWYVDKKHLPLLMMAPAYLLYSCYAIYYQLNHVYPIIIFPIVIAVVCLLLKALKTKRFNIAMIVLLLLSTVPAYFFMSWWLAHLDNTKFEAEVNAVFPDIELYSMNDQLVKLKDKGDTLLVLDFWSSSCGICFREFPDFKTLSDEYGGGKAKVKFYTVNIPLKRDSLSETKEVISRYFSDTEILFAKHQDAFKILNIEGVPIYYILKNNTILFKGHIEIGKGWKASLAAKIDVCLQQ